MAITLDNTELFEDIRGGVRTIHLDSSYLNKNTAQERVILKGTVNDFPVEILMNGKELWDFSSYDFTRFPEEIASLKKDVFNIINRYYNSSY